jgi:hypothetical protein
MAQLDESLAWVLPGAARVRRGSGCGADLPFGVRVDVVLEVGETDDVLRPHVYVTGPCGQLFDGPPDDARDWLRDQLGELAAALGGSQ